MNRAHWRDLFRRLELDPVMCTAYWRKRIAEVARFAEHTPFDFETLVKEGAAWTIPITP